MAPPSSLSSSSSSTPASIAIVGCGWWSQGWHLPHLSRNANSNIAGIVDISPHPKSTLNPSLQSLQALGTMYNCPIFSSVDDLLSSDLSVSLDGVIIATPHSTHSKVGEQFLQEAHRRMEAKEKPLHILMEKPMTTDVEEAKHLFALVRSYKSAGGAGCFLLNHSANYRQQIKSAKVLCEKLGEIRHIQADFASPLMWIFDDPGNREWNEPTGNMKGNGFAWGQQSHLLGWIFHACPTLEPRQVFCAMVSSPKTGADLAHSATVLCRNGAVLAISGTTYLPGNAHTEPPVGKRLSIQIYGTKGCLIYSGDDRDRDSGRLEFRDEEGAVSYPSSDNFDFENLEEDGTGPESIQAFIAACQGKEFYEGAGAIVGLRTIQTIDAMYRSNLSKKLEDVEYSDVA